ncbi:SNW/SKI-interacting protein A [Populus alba x Populus x berolinensis]|nr:SNW/SKI-interacting protein A [Populus alba x Populus x berolinensis]
MRMVEMPIVPFDLPSSNIRGFRRRQNNREDVAMRTKLHNEIMVKEKERRDQELRALAQRARQLVQDEQLINIPNTDRFRPDKVFAGTFERATQGDKPVLEFDTDAQNSDIFGMDELWK